MRQKHTLQFRRATSSTGIGTIDDLEASLGKELLKDLFIKFNKVALLDSMILSNDSTDLENKHVE